MPNFKGTRKETVSAAIQVLILDAFIFILCGGLSLFN